MGKEMLYVLVYRQLIGKFIQDFYTFFYAKDEKQAEKQANQIERLDEYFLMRVSLRSSPEGVTLIQESVPGIREISNK